MSCRFLHRGSDGALRTFSEGARNPGGRHAAKHSASGGAAASLGWGNRDTCRVADWAALFERETGRYRDGEERLGGDADERQRQLTRMGNAAWGAGLCLLMQGDADARS